LKKRVKEMMRNFTKIKLNLSFMLLASTAIAFGQDLQTGIADKVWEAIGGKDNWQNARYFMFSCIGGGTSSFVQGERKYLWDKQQGYCRFEGISTDDESVIALFNIKTNEGTVYINGEELSNPKTSADVIKEVAAEFERDAYLLFLPTALEGNQVSFTVTGEKLVGSQRFTVVNLKNHKTSFEAAVEGQLYLDAQTGRVLQWQSHDDQNRFAVGGFKDIGGGLVLPTRFTADDTTHNITYPIAAALVNIEAQKFNKP